MKTLPVLRLRYAVFIDVLSIVLSFVLACIIRFEPAESVWPYVERYQNLLWLSLVVRLPVYSACGLYRRLWRYASTRELNSLLAAGSLSSALILAVNFILFPALGIAFCESRSVPLLDWLLNLGCLGGTRLLLRLGQERLSRRARQDSSLFVSTTEQKRVLVVGAGDAVALSSGTAALHLALMLAGVSTGDEVLVSTLTFSASANPVVYLGARPTFIDSEARSWNMDPDLLAETLEKRARAGRLPKAVVLVHIYGQTADLEPILAACRRYGVPLIEDAAEALGADYHGRAAGTFDLAGVYSFNGNKIITTSGGGMLVSADQALIDHARKLATQAREPAPHYQHAEIGYNYRMSNLLAGVGRGQLRVLEERVAARRRNFDYYRQALGDLPGLTFQPEAPWGRHTRWLTCLTIDPALFGADREAVRLALERDNIEARPVWKPMHLQPVFAECDYIGSHVAQRLFENGLCLPSGSSLTEEELERICAIIRSACPAVQPRRSATVRLAPESQSVASAS